MSEIRASELCLDYPLIGLTSRSLKNRILGAATGGLITRDGGVSIVNALRSVSFQASDGDRLGLIGHNGAGKSTLLKVLAGIYRPTSGDLVVEGRVVATLNLALGMEPEATGLENIITHGLLLGMRRREIQAKLDDIAEFTELGQFLDMPVRIYSSGMATRLAFATVTAMDADILLMDEVIGAGDAAFMDKAERRLDSFMGRSRILVLASHSEAMIYKFCNKALLLERGMMLGIGRVEEMFGLYRRRVAAGEPA